MGYGGVRGFYPFHHSDLTDKNTMVKLETLIGWFIKKMKKQKG